MYVVTDEQAHEGIRGESLGTKKGNHREPLEDCVGLDNSPLLCCHHKIKLENTMDKEETRKLGEQTWNVQGNTRVLLKSTGKDTSIRACSGAAFSKAPETF